MAGLAAPTMSCGLLSATRRVVGFTTAEWAPPAQKRASMAGTSRDKPGHDEGGERTCWRMLLTAPRLPVTFVKPRIGAGRRRHGRAPLSLGRNNHADDSRGRGCGRALDRTDDI